MIDFLPFASSSRANLYVIYDGETKLMLECGLSWKATQRLLGFNTSSIKGLLLTHFHFDHSASVADVMKAGIDVWASSHTIEHMSLSGHRVHAITPMQPFEIGSWSIMGFDTPHDAEGTLGFFLTNRDGESFLFATDTQYLRYKFSNLVGIAIECNYSLNLLRDSVSSGAVNRAIKRRIIENHFSLENLIVMLKANDLSKCQQIFLLHISENNGEKQEFKRKIMEQTGVPVYV